MWSFPALGSFTAKLLEKASVDNVAHVRRLYHVKIHLMMTFVDMVRKIRLWIEHHESLFVLGNSRL